MATILVLNGPNLNLLDTREPLPYGHQSPETIGHPLTLSAGRSGNRLEFRQSDPEQELLDRIRSTPGQGVDFLVFNPAAFTQTSVALRDGLRAALDRLRARRPSAEQAVDDLTRGRRCTLRPKEDPIWTSDK